MFPQDVLHAKYFASQVYYYSRVIADLVIEAEGSANTYFQDVACLADDEEYLKRLYGRSEFSGKLITFKEYYFHHEHCPRIHTKDVEAIYHKWQDRKRDLAYRRLKVLYNEPPSDSSEHSIVGDPPPSHFLLNISEYNPLSKKYYLRVKARQ